METIDLRDLKEEERKNFQKAIEEEGYNFDEYKDNEPILYDQEALEEEYLESLGIDEKIKYYVDVKAMIRDDELSGFLRRIQVNNKEWIIRMY